MRSIAAAACSSAIGRQAAPTETGLDLEVDPEGRFALRRRANDLEQPVEQHLVADGQRDPAAGRLGRVFSQDREQHEDGTRMPAHGVRRLVERRDGEPVGPGSLERPRDRHRRRARRHRP